MTTTGKGGVISYQTSVKVVVSMIATSSVHTIILASDTITSPSPTSQGPETERPKTEEPEKNCLDTTVRPGNGQMNPTENDLKLKNPTIGSTR